MFGRAAAQAKGFAYSDALKASRLVWTEEALDRWLTDPEKTVPGQRMGVSVPDAKERADLIAYLRLSGVLLAPARGRMPSRCRDTRRCSLSAYRCSGPILHIRERPVF